MGKWTKYCKKYKKQWEKEEDLKDWIHAVEGDDKKAACRFCHNTLRAHHSDLTSHAATMKHKRNAGLGGVIKKEKGKSKKNAKGATATPKQEDITLSELLGTKDTDTGVFHAKLCPDEVVNPASLGFLGSGKIAQALLSTFLKEGLVDPHLVIASSPTDNNLFKLREMGVRTTHDNNDVVRTCDLVFVCVPPNMLNEMVNHLLPIEDDHSPLFVSVVAGVSLASLEEMLNRVVENPRVVRALPNIPSGLGHGCCLFSRGSHTSSSDAEVMRSMLESVDLCDEMPECHLDAAWGIVSSSPAFSFMAIEAIADGGVKMGLPRQVAQTLAAQMVKEASAMVLETHKHPGELKDEICSSSKAAINALHTLERHAFRNALMSAVEVAIDKKTRPNHEMCD